MEVFPAPVLAYALDHAKLDGLVLEFGVFRGDSLRFIAQRSTGLVQHHEARIAIEGAHQSQALALAAREEGPVLADAAVVARRHGHDGLVQAHRLRDRLHLHDEIPDSAFDDDHLPYYRPSEDSIEYQYMVERRRALGGSIPKRIVRPRRSFSMPSASTFEELLKGSGEQAVSTTMGFTRLLRSMARDPEIGQYVVPIIPDEGRTFGMDSLFPALKIYASQGQKYEPVDHDLLLSYVEASKGQILEEGITEAGSMSSFIAAGTSYATHGVPMVPFYIFYSMFGMQRVGDLAWAAGDLRARGLVGLHVVVDDDRLGLVRHRQELVAVELVVHALAAEAVARLRLDVEKMRVLRQRLGGQLRHKRDVARPQPAAVGRQHEVVLAELALVRARRRAEQAPVAEPRPPAPTPDLRPAGPPSGARVSSPDLQSA